MMLQNAISCDSFATARWCARVLIYATLMLLAISRRLDVGPDSGVHPQKGSGQGGENPQDKRYGHPRAEEEANDHDQKRHDQQDRFELPGKIGSYPESNVTGDFRHSGKTNLGLPQGLEKEQGYANGYSTAEKGDQQERHAISFADG